jgi:hypothetical protein
LAGAGQIDKLSWNQDQSWLYISTRRGFEVVETKSLERRVLISADNYRGLEGALLVPQINKLFVTWLRPDDESGGLVTETYVYDGSSFALLDTEGVAASASSIVSADGLKCYDYGPDSSGKQSVFAISFETKALVSEVAFSEFGPRTELKSLLDGKRGKALLSYEMSPGFLNQRYCVLDLETNVVDADFPMPFRSEAQLSANGRHVLVQEVTFDYTRPQAEERTGLVYVFSGETGTLSQRLRLPGGGRFVVFDNYPDNCYYYIERQGDRRFVGFDITTRTSSLALLDTLIALKHQAYAAGHLGDQNFVKELDNGLENARKHLARSDSVNCRKLLEDFQSKVKREYERKEGKGSKRFVTQEAYLQLYFNAGYIVDRLPDRGKPEKEKDKGKPRKEYRD